MSLMSGLVETGAEEVIVSKPSRFGEWAVRNAWRLVVAGSSVFWLTVLGVVLFG